ncbi:hypothetical protein A2U01_0117454, partial [Trifolium medium]|nr:hypothetical protein [Trifolium medium]
MTSARESAKGTKTTRNTGKKPLYGPPRTKSKNVPAFELKRKELPSSDSEFEIETSAAT